MERLTIPDEKIDERTTRRTFIDVAAVREHAMEFYWRLKDYEDTRLTSGEVRSLRGEWDAMMRVLNSIGGYDRLREIAEADKEGRVVILPCEPGTTVYITFCGKVWEMRVGQFRVNGYTKQIRADIDCDWASTQCVRWDLAIGKTVFMTREEAEAALKEVQNDTD